MIAVHMGKGLGANRLSFSRGSFSCGSPQPPLDEAVQQTLRRYSSMGMDVLVAMLALNRFEFGRFD
jgi:hypothetical protein